jgi:NADPH:quinone reductase-like Zn-dependent oxidoreductase
MKAARIHESGGVESYVYEDAPDPVAGPGEVRVRVRAVALNHLEAWAAKAPPGAKYDPPRILGADVAGEIDSVGPGVTHVKPGDAVMVQPGVSCGHCLFCLRGQDNRCPGYRLLGQGRDGGLAEYVVVPAVNVFPKPERLSFEEAASIPLVFVTAWHMLMDRAKLRRGDVVLVNGAGSGVGSAAIQIARLHGAGRIIATAGSAVKLEKARELGADDAIDYTNTKVDEEARRLTGGRGVDVVVEHVGGEIFEASVRALAPDGRLVTCGATAGPTATLNVTRFFLGHQTILGSFMGRKEELLEAMPYFASGQLRPVVDSVYPLSEIRAAVTRMLNREQFGKIVLVP